MREAFAGIDVACAKRKILPINVSVLDDGRLVPIALRDDASVPPRGAGNVQTLNREWLDGFANDTAAYLRSVERSHSVRIVRIAIDAPSDPKLDGTLRRKAESALDALGISCFTTPSHGEFQEIASRVRAHLAAGGLEARLPRANQLWMLVGFALFERLRRDWECLEVYPQATVALLGCHAVHKSKLDGLVNQLTTIRGHTGWPDRPDPARLRPTGRAKVHDCLDAYLAAWVASLPADRRKALGAPPDDVIWVPNP